jgi:hypothetical protein
MPKQRGTQQTLTVPSVKHVRENQYLPLEVENIPASLQLTFRLSKLGDTCFLLCNDACVGTVHALGLPESKGFPEAQLGYIEKNLESDLLMAAQITVRSSFDYAASVSIQNATQARSWRKVGMVLST